MSGEMPSEQLYGLTMNAYGTREQLIAVIRAVGNLGCRDFRFEMRISYPGAEPSVETPTLPAEALLDEDDFKNHAKAGGFLPDLGARYYTHLRTWQHLASLNNEATPVAFHMQAKNGEQTKNPYQTVEIAPLAIRVQEAWTLTAGKKASTKKAIIRRLLGGGAGPGTLLFLHSLLAARHAFDEPHELQDR